MSATKKRKKVESMYRLNTRIRHDQIEFVKAEVKKEKKLQPKGSKEVIGDGTIIRVLLDEAISNRKAKK